MKPSNKVAISSFIVPSLIIISLSFGYAATALLVLTMAFHLSPAELYNDPPGAAPLIIKLITLAFNLVAVGALYKLGTRELPAVASLEGPEFINLTRPNSTMDTHTRVVIRKRDEQLDINGAPHWDFNAPQVHRLTGAPPTEQLRQVVNKEDQSKSWLRQVCIILLALNAAIITYAVYAVFTAWGKTAILMNGLWARILFNEAEWLNMARLALAATPDSTLGFLALPVGIASLGIIVDTRRQTPTQSWRSEDWNDQTTVDPDTAITMRTSAQASTLNVGGVIIDLHRPFNMSLTQTRGEPHALTVSLSQGRRRLRFGALIAMFDDERAAALISKTVPIMDTLAPILDADQFLKVWAVVQHHHMDQNNAAPLPIEISAIDA